MLKKKESTKAAKANDTTKTSMAKRKGTPSVIADDMNILGNLISDGYVDINGHIEGNVKCEALTVREHGIVKGDVFADSVHVYGQISGLIKAKHVILASTARVRGVIMHESMAMEEGAYIDGQCKRTDRSSMLENASPSSKSDNIELIENFRVISGEGTR